MFLGLALPINRQIFNYVLINRIKCVWVYNIQHLIKKTV